MSLATAIVPFGFSVNQIVAALVGVLPMKKTAAAIISHAGEIYRMGTLRGVAAPRDE